MEITFWIIGDSTGLVDVEIDFVSTQTEVANRNGRMNLKLGIISRAAGNEYPFHHNNYNFITP